MASVLDIFAPGLSTWLKVAVIGGVAIASAGGATFATANYYNNKIINAQSAAAEKLDSAVQKGAVDAMAAQKAADAKEANARAADQAKRDARNKVASDALLSASEWLSQHPVNSTDCIVPKETAHALNTVIQ